MESRKRSMTKSLIWRLIGVIFLACVTFYYTGSIMQTTWITFVHHFSFIWIYFFHERVWLGRFDDSRYKKYAKILTYEIVLGNGVLGTISWIYTGSWTNVTQITLTYIINKLWMYYVYERLWERIQWETKKV